MRALILQNDPTTAVANSQALIDKGFQILCVDTREVAETLVKMDTIDLLVMDEQVQGQLTHSIALSGERKNPLMSAILMTDRTGAETDDLYDLIPSLYALAGADTASSIVGQLALASVANSPDAAARVAENQALDQAEASEPDDICAATDNAASLAEDDCDVPSYADVIFATPALAELRDANIFSNLDDDDDDDVLEDATDLVANFFARSPLVLTEAMSA